MNTIQAELLDKAADSLRAAHLLLENGHNDVAASRAYYVMFYAASALLLGEGHAFSRHSAVIAAFGRLFAKSEQIPSRFHRYLIDASADRNRSDYEPRPALTREQAQMHIERASEFLEVCRQYNEETAGSSSSPNGVNTEE